MEKLDQRTAKSFLKDNVGEWRGRLLKLQELRQDCTGGKTGKLTNGREYVCVYL